MYKVISHSRHESHDKYVAGSSSGRFYKAQYHRDNRTWSIRTFIGARFVSERETTEVLWSILSYSLKNAPCSLDRLLA